jgi:uncharacterized protein (TIGR02598 family)
MLMGRPYRHSPLRGFSLVEVVIALGLFTFCVVAITGLFGVGLGAARSAANDAITSSLAESIYGAWQMQKDPAAELVIPPMFTNALPPLSSGAAEDIYLNDAGEQVPELRDAALLLNYNTRSVSPATYRLELFFKWPAAASSAGQQTRSYSRTFYKPNI